MKRSAGLAAVVLALAMLSTLARGQEPADSEKIVSIGLQAEMILQGLVNSHDAIESQSLLGLATAQEGDILDGTVAAQIQFRARVGDYWRAYGAVELGKGDGVDPILTSVSFFNFAAQSASQSATLDQLWAEGGFQYASLKFGQIDWIREFDTNAAANSEVYQFLTRSFVTNPVIYGPNGRLSPNPGANQFNTLAMIVTFLPSENIAVKYGVFENDGDLNKIEPKDLVHFAELDLHWNLGDNPGNFRFLYSENDGEKALYPDRTLSTDVIPSLAVNFDQALDNFTFFGRYGTVLNNRAAMYYSPYTTSMTMPIWHLSGGVVISELPLNGSLGLAYGYNRLPIEWRDRIENNNQDADKGEGIGEAYYRMRINDLVSIIPNLVFMQSPAGVEDCKEVFAYGSRVVVDF